MPQRRGYETAVQSEEDEGGDLDLAPWNLVNATLYCRRMLSGQFSAVTPIVLFLLAYQRLVLSIWPTDGWLLAAGFAAVVLGLALFMEGLKFGLVRLIS